MKNIRSCNDPLLPIPAFKNYLTSLTGASTDKASKENLFVCAWLLADRVQRGPKLSLLVTVLYRSQTVLISVWFQ